MINLITDNINIWTSAQTVKANGRGRGSNGQSPHGIKKLRELILELAVRGKLVPQDSNDEPASVLLKKIAKESKIKNRKKLPEIGDNEKPFNLPRGWGWQKLGEIGTWAVGSGFPKKDQGFEGLEILFSKVSDMNLEGNEKYIYTTVNTISEKTAIKLKINVHHEGTVIFPKIGGAIATNKRRIIVKPTAIDNNCLGITPMAGLDTTYLYLYLSSIDLTEYQAGTSVPALNQGKLELITLGLPPIAEQHRIVAKVDELMALCDRLEEQQTDSTAAHQTLVVTLLATLTNAADQAEFTEAWQRIANHFNTLFTTEQSIDQLKQTILQLAVMGKLVHQNPKDEPASKLLEKIAKEKARLVKEGKIKKQKPLPEITKEETPFELPKCWEYSRLGDFTIVGTGSTPARGNPNYYFPAEINWVTSGETSNDFITETKETISPLAVSETNVTVYPIGTLIVAMYGQGKTRGQVAELLIEAGTNQACAAIQPVAGEVHHRKYIKYFFKKAYEELRSHAAGGAQPNLNVGKVSQTVIPLPPLAEQYRIVAKADELMSLCDTLKERLNDAQTTQIQLADTIVEQAVG